MSDALMPPVRRARSPGARALGVASAAVALPDGFRPRPEAALLLSQILARLHGVDLPAIQFVQVTPGEGGERVVRCFAEACVARLGRTLLVTVADTPGKIGQPLPPEEGGRQEVRRRIRKPGVDATDLVPDSVFPGLYHARCGDLGDPFAATPGPETAWLGRGKPDFRLLAIDCGPVRDCTVVVDFATRCHGTVLSVEAGAASLAQIQAAARQVRLAGGTLIGSVLYDAPRRRWV